MKELIPPTTLRINLLEDCLREIKPSLGIKDRNTVNTILEASMRLSRLKGMIVKEKG